VGKHMYKDKNECKYSLEINSGGELPGIGRK
jgi:hypothetical protein